MTAAVDDRELLHHYAPRGAARELLESRHDQVLVSGPAGTGKSRACLEKMHLAMLKYPGARGMILRKTLASLGSTALKTWEEHVIPEALAAGVVKYHGGSSRKPAQYVYSNGSTVTIGGLDKASKIMSSEYDMVFIQEAVELTEADWEAVISRLRNGRIPYQQIIADTNPDAPHHWLNKRCDAGQTLMLHSRHRDNPVYYDDKGTPTEAGRAYVEGKLAKLTGVRYHRLYLGMWVAAEGVIYEDWDPAVHLVDRFWIPKTWRRWWVVDFGYTNPFVLQWWAEDPDGRLFLYREIYHTRRLVADHAKQALRIVRRCVDCCESDTDGHDCYECAACVLEWREPKPRAVICDHDAEGRAQLRKVLGLGTTAAAKKKVTAGIEAVQMRLRVQDDGKPRLFILRDSLVERDQELADAGKPTCTQEEITGYIWDTSGGRKIKEEPVKEDDHGMDGTRYMVAQRDLGGRPGVRFL